MGIDFNCFPGQTPLDEDEKEGLLNPFITTRMELDEFEQQNIEQAILWTLKRKFTPNIIFNTTFVLLVHEKMFNTVWRWAGDFRKSNKNIGVDKWEIQIALHALIDDLLYWHTHNTFEPDEVAVRFKHRLVAIHCFPNGNGRHSRLMADIIISKVYKRPVFTWGAASIDANLNARAEYLKALKAADRGNYAPLLAFARS